MIPREPARTKTRRIRGILVAGLLVVVAAIVGPVHQAPASPSSTVASPIEVPRTERRRVPGEADGADVLHGEHRRTLGEADGAIPDGVTVFDVGIPGVARLDPALLGALRHATTDAADEGVEILIDSGWRSAKYQKRLLREAVSEHGSEEEAARWVATAATSAHVSGDAVDIGDVVARAWLAEHGARYGLCQIYRNEPWHFELRPEAIDDGCPPMYADPTRDPRMEHDRHRRSIPSRPR